MRLDRNIAVLVQASSFGPIILPPQATLLNRNSSALLIKSSRVRGRKHQETSDWRILGRDVREILAEMGISDLSGGWLRWITLTASSFTAYHRDCVASALRLKLLSDNNLTI